MAAPHEDDAKPAVRHVEMPLEDDLHKGEVVQMRSTLDEMSVFRAVWYYKRTGILCMLAAFSASLEGYQVNLNGSIVSNTGFIHKLFGENAKSSPGPYVSAWGGIHSAGQFFGQVGLQFVTEKLGRKWALYVIWFTLVISVMIESLTTHWWQWLLAKLFSGLGVGMLQSTLPVYIAEHSPTQLRGLFINVYTFWFVVGQIMAPVALRELNISHPTEFKIAIYTQWAMLGIMIIIFVFLPESPWWLVSRGRIQAAEKVLRLTKGNLEGYSVEDEVSIMHATILEENAKAEASGVRRFEAFRGRNLLRFVIAGWPKITQQFVGLAVFNTYATYFFQLAGNKDSFTVTVILACVQLLSVIASALLTDTFGRRPFTIYGYSITVLAVLCLGIVGCFNYETPQLGSLLIFFACLATFSNTAASAIGYAYLAEIPQQRLRAQTAGLSLASCNLVAILFSFTTPLMLNGVESGSSTGGWKVKTAFLFAGTGAVSVVVSWFILPEVARRTPAEIDEMFEKKVSLRNFKGYRTDVQNNLQVAQGQE